jgi:hypothetical protein
MRVRPQKKAKGVPRRYGNAARASKRRRHFLSHGKSYTGR